MTLSLTEACVRCHFTASGILCPSLLASLLNYSFQSLCCKVPLSSLGKYKVSHSVHCLRWNAPCDMSSGYKYQICGKKKDETSRTMCRLGLFVVLCALKPSHFSVVSIQCCCLPRTQTYSTLYYITLIYSSNILCAFQEKTRFANLNWYILIYIFFDIFYYIKHFSIYLLLLQILLGFLFLVFTCCVMISYDEYKVNYFFIT